MAESAGDDPSTAVVDDLVEYFADEPAADRPGRDALASFLDLSPLEEQSVVEGYWIRKPFAYAVLIEGTDHTRYGYRVLEPQFDEFEQYLRQDLTVDLRSRLLDISAADRADAVEAHVDDLLDTHADAIPPATRRKLRYRFERDFAGYGVVDPFMQDPNVEDVSCNGTHVPIFVYHRNYGHIETGLDLAADDLESLVIRLAQRAGRHLSAAEPLLTTTLPDGSRLQATLESDVATRGSNFTIRLFREEPFTPVDLADHGTYSIRQLAYLWLLVEHNRSVLFAGPTASGKTTSMNATTLFVPPDSKVVSIEETREINLPHDNWVATATRESDAAQDRPTVGMYELLSEALHQRPDYVLVGELRTEPEVVMAFFQAIGTGHEGFTTFHADSARDVVRRFTHHPLDVPPELLTDLDVISVQRLRTGENIRRCHQLVELHPRDSEFAGGTAAQETDEFSGEISGEFEAKFEGGFDGDEGGPVSGEYPALHEVFSYDVSADEFLQLAPSGHLRNIAEEEGWTDEELHREIRERQQVLADLLQRGVMDYEDVTDVLFRYAQRPEQVLDGIDTESLPELHEVDVSNG